MNKLKYYRNLKNLTQDQLSAITGLNRMVLSHYEQGYRSINNASAISVYKLAKALDVTIEELLDI